MLSGLYELRNALSRQPIVDNNGKWYFRKVDISAETVDSFDRCKLFFKKYPRVYYFLIKVISPVRSIFRFCGGGGVEYWEWQQSQTEGGG